MAHTCYLADEDLPEYQNVPGPQNRVGRCQRKLPGPTAGQGLKTMRLWMRVRALGRRGVPNANAAYSGW
jgi:hypothetical protein